MKSFMSQMKVASFVSDCRPLPPTPTSNAFPRCMPTIRANRQMCSIASRNRTWPAAPGSGCHSRGQCRSCNAPKC
eukprot:1767122-Rhodomonas_salina.1